jgi:hypothetical protein
MALSATRTSSNPESPRILRNVAQRCGEMTCATLRKILGDSGEMISPDRTNFIRAGEYPLIIITPGSSAAAAYPTVFERTFQNTSCGGLKGCPNNSTPKSLNSFRMF